MDNETQAEERRVLVVEDEAHLAAGLKLNLEFEGYAVDIAASARQAAACLTRPGGYDVIILDVMLPDSDGFTICRQLRESRDFTPVLMLTARNQPHDRVLGLESGADDYLSKTFELDELIARVRSLLRRRSWERRSTEEVSSHYRFGEVQVDFDRHEVRVRGQEVILTALELELLRYFAQNPERVLSRAELLENVWKLHNYPNTRTVDNFVMRLRRHFELDPASPVHFHSVRGAGYKFVPDAPAA